VAAGTEAWRQAGAVAKLHGLCRSFVGDACIHTRRQFPHLAGMADADIRALARRALARRPDLVRLLRVRNVVVFVGMVAAAALLGRGGGPGVGGAMQGVGWGLMAAGAGATAALLLWNPVWVNTVLFRLTRAEVERSRA
jgi:hypothetical protein